MVSHFTLLCRSEKVNHHLVVPTQLRTNSDRLMPNSHTVDPLTEIEVEPLLESVTD